jgi:DDE superfamily endonuclease
VTAWVHANRHRIELVYLPPYAPEHNPDEFMHNDLKQTLARRCILKDKAGPKAFLRSHMHRLQKMPAKVRVFFQAREVRYAA